MLGIAKIHIFPVVSHLDVKVLCIVRVQLEYEARCKSAGSLTVKGGSFSPPIKFFNAQSGRNVETGLRSHNVDFIGTNSEPLGACTEVANFLVEPIENRGELECVDGLC